ncbi:hypothetical protein RJ641_021482 [Dillenia turbinata]|uniref:Uncharacterized protein n=1 Tax=Dillenia turbinata TaxID=194707 RepID=A0AAN8YV31_9MAGN
MEALICLLAVLNSKGDLKGAERTTLVLYQLILQMVKSYHDMQYWSGNNIKIKIRPQLTLSEQFKLHLQLAISLAIELITGEPLTSASA